MDFVVPTPPAMTSLLEGCGVRSQRSGELAVRGPPLRAVEAFDVLDEIELDEIALDEIVLDAVKALGDGVVPSSPLAAHADCRSARGSPSGHRRTTKPTAPWSRASQRSI